MDIKVIAEKRRQLETELYRLIESKVREFETNTGVAIGGISIEISHAVEYGNQSDIPTVRDVIIELLWPK